MPLIEFTSKGLCCQAGGFYIDPWRPVEKAVITHAHSDHARAGSGAYLCHRDTKPLLQLRLGSNSYQTVEWNEPVPMNNVKVSLHPAGHVIGSSQVRIEQNGEVWVVSGDYKLEDDGLSGRFEAVRCHTFITESTFGLPIYRWQEPKRLFESIDAWWRANAAENRASVLFAYAFGKAQRILASIDASIGPILLHGAVEPLNRAYREAGVP